MQEKTFRSGTNLAYTLRPSTDEDFDFLYDLKVACLKEYVAAAFGWDEDYQRQRFAEHFNAEEIQIIMQGDHDIGSLSVEQRDTEVYVAGIYIAPEKQNQGLGTAVLLDVISDASESGLDVTLQVLKVNLARRLYERLGFRTHSATEHHYQMRLDSGI